MMARISALDGLRGLAISLVILLHFFKRPLTGWIGVDIFFVLSGYLITTILLQERHEASYWKIFYTRRITRILPPYIVLIVGAALLTPLPWHQIWPFYAFFAANFAYLRVGQAGVGVLFVLWSLAVEEHFYFVWPAIVRNFRHRTLALILVGVILAEPLVRLACTGIVHDYSIFYTLTPFRFDGLAMGSLLAIILAHRASRERFTKWLGPCFYTAMTLSFLMLIVFRRTREHNTVFFSAFGYSLIAIASTMLLGWLILRPESELTRAFSFRPLIFLGRISYSLYLYHVLIQNECQVFARHFGFPSHYPTEIAGLLLSILVAWISFEVFETKFMAYGRDRVRSYRAKESKNSALRLIAG